MKKSLFLLCSSVIAISSAQAHNVWVNAFLSDTHQPPHALLSLGWGHTLPMDDILNSPNGSLSVKTFELISPSMTKTPLLIPAEKTIKPQVSNDDIDIFPAELALQKVAFKDNATPGVYQISATTPSNFYTQYIDKKGRKRLKRLPKNQIDDIDKVLMSVKYQAFAKSYVTLGEWQQPAPLGHGLEITPLTDLSTVRTGDLVKFSVKFYGEPLSANAKSMDYITAHSDSFGQADHFALHAYVMEGTAQFRVQSAGQWVVNINHKEDVTADGPLKALFGKAEQVYHAASLTFHVK